MSYPPGDAARARAG